MDIHPPFNAAVDSALFIKGKIMPGKRVPFVPVPERIMHIAFSLQSSDNDLMQYCHILIGWNDIHTIRAYLYPILCLVNLHFRVSLQYLHHDAF